MLSNERGHEPVVPTLEEVLAKSEWKDADISVLIANQAYLDDKTLAKLGIPSVSGEEVATASFPTPAPAVQTPTPVNDTPPTAPEAPKPTYQELVAKAKEMGLDTSGNMQAISDRIAVAEAAKKDQTA